MSTFQIIVLGIFTTLILLGVGVFATLGGVGGSKSVGSVTVWGTISSDIMDPVLTNLRQSDKSFQNVEYVQRKAATYQADLLNAMANGTAPDLAMLPLENLEPFADKILVIPYSSISQSTFVNSYLDEAQLLLVPTGTLGIPFTIDPLVMYWNRDLFAGAGVANPPQFWNEFISLAPKITSLDGTSQVTRSTVALGEWVNIPNAKAILSALIMQTGDSIVARDSTGAPVATFGQAASTNSGSPAASALRFYTEFANPTKTSYSWNRALPNAFDSFTSGDLAVYFGFVSEASSITARNPNLHYSMAVLPQIQDGSIRATYGRMTVLVVPRGAKNPAGALVVAEGFTGQAGAQMLLDATGLPSVRRDIAPNTAANASAAIITQSAIMSRGWLDPNPAATNQLFQTMIESIASGKQGPDEAVQSGIEAFSTLIRRP